MFKVQGRSRKNIITSKFDTSDELSCSSLSGSIQTNFTPGRTVQCYREVLSPRLFVSGGYCSEHLQQAQHRISCFGKGELLCNDLIATLFIVAPGKGGIRKRGRQNALTPNTQTRTSAKWHIAPARLQIFPTLRFEFVCVVAVMLSVPLHLVHSQVHLSALWH